MKKLLFVISIILLCIQAQGQRRTQNISDFRISQYTTREGLPDNAVRALHQDSRGFIWIGLVEGGVCRFDGHEFRQIICEDGSSLLSADSHVINIKEDKLGHIWIETYFSGVACYDIHNECFVDYGRAEGGRDFRYVEVFDNEVWLYNKSSDGCCRIRFDDKGQAESLYLNTSNATLPSDKIFYISQNRSGDVYIGTREGLVRVRGTESSILDNEKFFISSCSSAGENFHIDIDGIIYDEDQAGELRVLTQTHDRNDLIAGTIESHDYWYIFSQKRYYIFNFEDKSVSINRSGENISTANIHKIDKDAAYAFDKYGRVFYYDKISDRVTTIDAFKGKENLGDNMRLRFGRSQNGQLLIAANGFGLMEYGHAGGLNELNLERKLNDPQANFLLDILTDRDGNIWLATMYCGIIKLSPSISGSHFIKLDENPEKSGISNMVKMVRIMDNDIVVSTADGKMHRLDMSLKKRKTGDDNIINAYCATFTADGTPVFGTNGSGLRIGNKSYRVSDRDENSIHGNKVFDVLTDSKDRLWVALLDGGLDLGVKDANGGYSFRNFFTDSYPYPSFRTLHMDKEGKVWAGGNMGVYIFDPDELLADNSSYTTLNKAGGQLPGNHIVDITGDDKGGVWIAVSGSGICHIPAESKSIEHYGTEHGLINNRVRNLQFDYNGDLWIMTENGVSNLIMSSMTFVNYHFSSNNQGNTHNFGSAVLLPSGSILAGTNDGLISINPNAIKLAGSHIREGLIFTSFKQEKSAISASFSAMDYNEDTQYTYILEGFDQEWVQAGRKNSIHYANVPSGEYTLRVRASSKKSGYTEASMPINIRPPLFLSSGAIIIYLFILIMMIIVFFKTRKENDQLKTQVEEHDKVRDIWRKQITEKNDDEFCAKLDKIMSRHFSDASFTMDNFASEMAMSRSAFYVKVSDATGDTPNKYMRSFRLKKATDLLLNSKTTVEEVAYMCGFKDPGYFSKLFKAEYGITPKQYKTRATR